MTARPVPIRADASIFLRSFDMLSICLFRPPLSQSRIPTVARLSQPRFLCRSVVPTVVPVLLGCPNRGSCVARLSQPRILCCSVVPTVDPVLLGCPNRGSCVARLSQPWIDWDNRATIIPLPKTRWMRHQVQSIRCHHSQPAALGLGSSCCVPLTYHRLPQFVPGKCVGHDHQPITGRRIEFAVATENRSRWHHCERLAGCRQAYEAPSPAPNRRLCRRDEPRRSTSSFVTQPK